LFAYQAVFGATSDRLVTPSLVSHAPRLGVSPTWRAVSPATLSLCLAFALFGRPPPYYQPPACSPESRSQARGSGLLLSMATRFPHLAFVSLSGGRPPSRSTLGGSGFFRAGGHDTSCSTVGASGFYSEGGPLAQRPTTEELARHILRRLYEATDGRPMEWRTLVTHKTT